MVGDPKPPLFANSSVFSFKATLDELKSADLLLHVVDISDPDFLFKLEEVNILLEELNLSHIPQYH